MAAPDPLPRLKRPQIAALLQANERSVSRWEHEGLPVAEPGRGGKASLYDPAAVVAWYVARRLAELTGPANGALDPDAERARKDRAQAQLAEQKYQVQTSALILAADAEREWTEAVQDTRAALLALPNALAPRCVAAATDGVVAVQRVLLDGVRDALRGLATWGRQGEEPR